MTSRPGLRPLRRPALVAAVLAALLLPVPLGAQGTQPQAALEWWGPEAVGNGFHLRVPVTVHNGLDYEVQNGMVLAEIDATELLVEAGWVHEVRGLQNRLSSFDLDPYSIRVVEMFDLKPPKPGTKHGLVAAYDPTLPADDLERFVVPSTHYTGFVEDRAGQPFDNRTNPIITVMWRVEDAMAPGDERYFVVYFDSLKNGEHGKPDYRRAHRGDALYGSFWSEPATDLFGYARPTATAAAKVTVLGLHDDTEVSVLISDSGGSFAEQVPAPGLHTNPFLIDYGASVEVGLGNVPTTFRLVANRPILALGDSEGFVPSLTGGFTGDEFLFATTYPPERMQDSLIVLNRHPDLRTNPDVIDTVVDLQPLTRDGQPDGPSQEIHLSNSVNPFHYTMALRYHRPSDSTLCTFDSSPTNPRIGSSPTAYRARVVQGGPVAIQFDAVAGVGQVPAIDEGPIGTEFWPVLARKNFPQDDDGSCPDALVEAYNVFAMAAEPADITVWSLDTPSRLFPSCASPPCEPVTVGPLGQTGDFMTVDTADFTDRPLEVRATKPGWLIAGRTESQTLGQLDLRGPLGGFEGARVFSGIGDALLYAPYEDTRIEAEIGGAGERVLFNIAQGRAVSLADAAESDVRGQWYLLRSSRPLLVTPTAEDSGFLAGVPPMLTAQTHAAEYRGYLVDIRSKSGLNPVTASTVPGEAVTYEFIVTNLGRGAGRVDLSDTIRICPTGIENLPAGWTADVQGSTSCDEPSSVTLGTNETRLVRLIVTPPENAAVGDVVVGVRAASSNNPAIFDSIATVTHVKRSFEVGLWFDFAGRTGLKQKEVPLLSANESAEYNVVVRNDGSVTDTITLTLTPPEGGWDVLLDGQSTAQFTLGPSDTRSLTLAVEPPDDLVEGSLLTTITAQSSVPSVVDRITAITKLEAPSVLSLRAEEGVRWTGPGEETEFAVELRNEGDGSARVFLATQHDGLPGWNSPDVFLRNVVTGELQAIDQLFLSSGESAQLVVITRPPSDALAGDRSTLRLNAATDVAGESREVFLHTVVEAVHNLTAHLDPVVRVEPTLREVTVELRLENAGNLNETIRPRIESMPPGWDVALPSAVVAVPRNSTQSLDIDVLIPDGAKDGRYDVAVRFASDDGNHTVVGFSVVVGAFSDLVVETRERIPAQPGRAASLLLNVSNVGNVPLILGVESGDGEPWSLLSGAEAKVYPGDAAGIMTGWNVPADAPDGQTQHELNLVARSDGPQATTLSKAVGVDVDVQRAQLQVGDVFAFEGAAGRVVHATIVNEGSRPAYDVDVQLLVGAEVVDETVLVNIAPGISRNVTLLHPLGANGTATVVIDPADTVVELDEEDNTRRVAAASDVPTPANSIVAVVTAVAGAAFLCRRHLMRR